ncbi:MAG TPA: CBS domain-containing protein [Symbiobacteriaceae bacterium]|nr:CBS domain-containing protein [Symbiobacteriaceae bacterium]
MLVRDVMTTPVIRVRLGAKVCEALRVMVEHKVDGVPVVDDRNHVQGVLTYADLLRRGRRQHPRALDFFMFAVVLEEEDQEVYARLKRILDLPVEQVATREVISCSPGDHLADVAGVMVDNGIKRMPVVAENGSLVGILSRGDLMRALYAQFERDTQPEDDAESEA